MVKSISFEQDLQETSHHGEMQSLVATVTLINTAPSGLAQSALEHFGSSTKKSNHDNGNFATTSGAHTSSTTNATTNATIANNTGNTTGDGVIITTNSSTRNVSANKGTISNGSIAGPDEVAGRLNCHVTPVSVCADGTALVDGVGCTPCPPRFNYEP